MERWNLRFFNQYFLNYDSQFPEQNQWKNPYGFLLIQINFTLNKLYNH